jgi:hypothetical protein
MKLRYHSWQPLLALVILTGILLAAWRASFAPGINRASFERIQLGMSRDQVSEILGRPADYGSSIKGYVESPFVFRSGPGPDKKEGAYQFHRWDATGFLICVIFDQRDEVACRYAFDIPWWSWSGFQSWAKSFLPGPPSPATAKANVISTKK